MASNALKQPQIQEMVNAWDTRWRRHQLLLFLPIAVTVIMGIAAFGALMIRSFGLMRVQDLTLALVVIIPVAIITTCWRFLRPTDPIISARAFDQRFGLQERVSTALELQQARIHGADVIAVAQIHDAQLQASQINAADYIPYRTRPWVWVLGFIFSIALVVILLIPSRGIASNALNPDTLRAIDSADDTVRDITEDIASQTSLSEEQRQRLLESLEQSLDELNQTPTSPEEAFATMSEVEQLLSDEANQLAQQSSDSQSALQSALEALNTPNPDQQNPGEALSEALSEAAANLENLSASEQSALAEALENASQSSEALSTLSEELRQAAEALQQQNPDAAREALEEAQRAAQEAQNQANQDQNNAEQLREAAEQAQESAREIARSENSEEPPSEAETGQQAEEPEDQSAVSSGGQQAGDSEESQTQQGQGEGQQQNESQSISPIQSDQGQPVNAQQPEGTAGNAQGDNGSGAGDSEASGQASNPSSQQGGSLNNPDGAGETTYEPIFAPESLNVSGSTNLQLESSSDDQPLVEGDFQDNPFGEASVPYNRVFSDYSQAANRAIENDYIPLGLRSVIRQYFTSLEPQGND